MGVWSARPCRAKAAGGSRPAHHESGLALTRDEQRRFDEIARRIDHDPAATDVDEHPIPPTTAVIPVRLAALGLFVVGVTGVLTGLARNDAVVLAVVGLAPAASALLLIALARASGPAAAPPAGPLTTRLWLWLTTCAENGCDDHPVRLGWCSEHALGHDLGPDENWGDEESDPR